jgi:hypothetical protein
MVYKISMAADGKINKMIETYARLVKMETLNIHVPGDISRKINTHGYTELNSE